MADGEDKPVALVGPGSRPGRVKTVIEPPPEGDSDRFLRYSAGIFYTTDLNQCSIADLAKHPIYRAVPQWKLEEWSSADSWVDRRREIQERWRRQIEVSVGNELVRARVRNLKSLQDVYDKALEKLTDSVEDQVLEAKSWEGVAGALVKLAQLMDQWRTELAREIFSNPMIMGGAAGDAADQRAATAPNHAKLTVDEARAAAITILRQRQLPAGAPKKKPPPKKKRPVRTPVTE